jgi:hypothetical protein
MTPSGSSPVPKQLQKFVQRIETNASRSGRPEKVARLYGAWSACYVRYCTMTNRDWRVHKNAPYFLRYLQSEQEVGSPSLRRAAEGLIFVFEEMMGRELGTVSWRPPSGGSSQSSGSQPGGSQTSSSQATASGADASSGSSKEEADAEASSSAGPDQGSMLTRLLFHTSLPIQEAMDLRVGDVDLEAGMIYVSDALGTPKHIVEIPDAIGDALATHIREVRQNNPADPLDAPLFQANALKGRTAEANAAEDDAHDESDAPNESSPAPAEADPDGDRRSLWQYAES